MIIFFAKYMFFWSGNNMEQIKNHFRKYLSPKNIFFKHFFEKNGWIFFFSIFFDIADIILILNKHKFNWLQCTNSFIFTCCYFILHQSCREVIWSIDDALIVNSGFYDSNFFFKKVSIFKVCSYIFQRAYLVQKQYLHQY